VDEFAEVQASLRPSGTVGWWDKVLSDLDDKQVESLMNAARSKEITHRTIATVLGRWGFEVSVAQVGHWRRTHVG
jgi:hypothetical protein